ncbi:MAG TPA: hypothetical protein VH682_19070 [Gemmataceae bacterium]
MASASATRHGEALRKSTEITRTLRKMYWPKMSMIAPADVIAVLNEADVRFMLIGNYGITGWRDEPRVTEDVDILVQKRDHYRAARVIQEVFPELELEDSAAATRFHDSATGKQLIDLMKPNQPLFKVAFRQTVLVKEGYRIPNLEFALAGKFAAMTSPNRPQEKQFLDAADFYSMVEKNKSAIHLARLRQLGERAYQGGGTSIIQMVEDAKAGRRLEF